VSFSQRSPFRQCRDSSMDSEPVAQFRREATVTGSVIE
jgi:hypothetical protein